jgi:hypothetical protein
VLDYAGTIFCAFFVCGPVLYIGVLMLIDPASFLKSLIALAGVLRTLEGRFHGYQWHEQLQAPAGNPVSPIMRVTLRLAGSALAVCAVAYFADAVK